MFMWGAEQFWGLRGSDIACRQRAGVDLSVDSWESLSTAAIALAPSTPMSLSSSLPASAEGAAGQKCSWGANTFRGEGG